MNDEFHNLIKEICEKHNIKYNLISNGWVMVLEKNNIKEITVRIFLLEEIFRG